MKDILFIGTTGLDAAHLSLAGLLLILLAALFWLRSTTREERAALEAELRAEGRESDRLLLDLDARTAELETQRILADEARRMLAVAEARREEDDRRFGELAQGVMQRASSQFLQLANQTFEAHKVGAKGDLEKLMEPIGQTFAEFRKRVDDIEKVRTEHKSSLDEQIKSIQEGLVRHSDATGKLVSALSAPRGGGSWGEESLRNVLELSGMSAHADFVEQSEDRTDRGRLRPDVIIRMPGGRQIVIDAKVSVDDFLQAAGEQRPEVRAAHLAEHARKMRDNIRRLSAKEYWRDFEDRVDFVAMYVPGEQFYSGALEADRDLFDFAARKKVLIVTPSTLIALAKAVAYGWRQEEAAHNAREAADLGRQLYDALTVMGGHVERLGRTLGQSVGAYNSFVGSLERNVLSKARRFETLQISQSGAKPIPDLLPVEETSRALVAGGELRLDLREEADDEAAQ